MSEKIAEGEARPSIRKVAQVAGVSIATVSRVLGDPDKVADDTRLRVMEAVTKLNYKPNEVGRALRTPKSGPVALIISNIQNSFYAAIAHEIESRVNAIGQVMLLCATNEDPIIQDKYLEVLSARNVSGVLMLCAVSSRHLARTMRDNNVIFINRMLRDLKDYSFVGIDDYLPARDLAAAQLKSGPGPYAVIHGPLYSVASSDRLRGFMDVFKENGLKAGDFDVIEGRLTMESGYQGAARLFQGGRSYSGLFCGSDQIAYGAFRRCRELGIRVPEDLRIYGFDDNPLNDWLAPWLNTVRVPHVTYASETIGLLRELWAGGTGRSVLVPYDVVIRA